MKLEFADLLNLVRLEVRSRVRNGQMTERGLAGKAGVSQPYLHKILKGLRPMTPVLADRLLREMGFGLVDLLAEHARSTGPRKAAKSEGGEDQERKTASR